MYSTEQEKCRSDFKLPYIVRITYYYTTAPEINLYSIQEITMLDTIGEM